MTKYLILLIGLVYSALVFADASPKMNPRIEVHFSNNGKSITKLDSIVCFVKYKASETEDTLTLFHSTARWWTVGGINQKPNKNYNLELRSAVEYFQLKLIYYDIDYESKKIYPISTWSYIVLEVNSNKELSMDNSLFYTKWSDYLASLLITLILELIVIGFFKSMRGLFWKVTLLVIGANLITHPILWYLDTNFELNLALLEVGVVFIEFIILSLSLSKWIKIGPLLAYTISANILSWGFGGVVFWIYTH